MFLFAAVERVCGVGRLQTHVGFAESTPSAALFRYADTRAFPQREGHEGSNAVDILSVSSVRSSALFLCDRSNQVVCCTCRWNLSSRRLARLHSIQQNTGSAPTTNASRFCCQFYAGHQRLTHKLHPNNASYLCPTQNIGSPT